MKNTLLIIVSLSFLISCGSGEEPKEEKKETKPVETKPAAVTEKDTLYLVADYKNPIPADVPKKDKEMLRRFFTDSLNAELFALHLAFDSIKTEKQMLIYYNALMLFKDKASWHLSDLNASEHMKHMAGVELTADERTEIAESEADEPFDEYRMVLDYIMQGMEPADKYLHGLKLGCVAECSEPNYELVLDDLVKVAEITEGESDEKYMQLIIDYYTGEWDPNSMNAKWFQATWDYGGMSLLGEGHHLAFMKDSDELIKEKNIFESYINSYREDCFSDMALWKSYAYDKAKIIKEIEKVLKEVNLTASQKTALKSRLKEIKEHTSNSPDGTGLQFNCSTGDCIFG